MFVEVCRRTGCNFRTPRKIDNEDAHRDLAIHHKQDHDIEKEEAEKIRIREENRKLAEEREEKEKLHELKLAELKKKEKRRRICMN